MSVIEIKNLFDTNPNFIYWVPLVFLFICLIFWLVARLLFKNKESNKIKRIVKEIAADYVQDAALPDGLEGFVFIDFLVLTPTGILVIDVQNYNGFLFGGEAVDEWTQMIGHQSYKFKNPIPINQHHVHSVTTHAGDVPVQGRIVFTSLGNFPKGIPDGVSTTGNFKNDVSISVVGNSVPELYQQAWIKILAIVKKSKKKLTAQN